MEKETEALDSHEGGCLCGAVRYRVRGEPMDVILCHCRFCQRATGSAYLVETLFERERLEVIVGKPAVYDHVSAGSGKCVHVNFCRECGTKVFLAFERFPKTCGVFSGTFDDPGWFPRTPANSLHFFLTEAQDGTVLPAGTPVYPRHYWHAEGVPSVPQVFDAHTAVTPTVRAASETFASEHPAAS